MYQACIILLCPVSDFNKSPRLVDAKQLSFSTHLFTISDLILSGT